MFFKTLAGLMAGNSAVVFTVSDAGNGNLTISLRPITSRTDKDQIAALNHPLTLTGTPEEFDAELANTLSTYGEARKSLEEQLDATVAILDAQKQASSKKAVKALSKTSTAGAGTDTSGPVPADEGEDEGGNENTTAQPSAAAASSTAAISSDNLFE